MITTSFLAKCFSVRAEIFNSGIFRQHIRSSGWQGAGRDNHLLERVSSSPNTKGKKICTNITDSDLEFKRLSKVFKTRPFYLLAQVVLNYRHLFCAALGTEKASAMATMMSSCSQTKLGLEFTFHQALETLHQAGLNSTKPYLAFFTDITFTPPWLC